MWNARCAFGITSDLDRTSKRCGLQAIKADLKQHQRQQVCQA